MLRWWLGLALPPGVRDLQPVRRYQLAPAPTASNDASEVFIKESRVQSCITTVNTISIFFLKLREF